MGGECDSVKGAVLGAIAEFRKDTNDRLNQSHQKLATRQDDIIIGVVKDVVTLKKNILKLKCCVQKNASEVVFIVSENKHLSDQTAAFIQ